MDLLSDYPEYEECIARLRDTVILCVVFRVRAMVYTSAICDKEAPLQHPVSAIGWQVLQPFVRDIPLMTGSKAHPLTYKRK